MRRLFLPALLAVLLLACNLEKDLDIEVPVYDRQLVVEAYLQPGQPFKVLLTESSGYLEGIEPPLVNEATVALTYQGQTYPLRPALDFDPETFQFRNFVSDFVVPEDYESEFGLLIEDARGRRVQAQTRLLPVVPIDSVRWTFRDSDTTAFLLTTFTDMAGEENFYRIVINRDSVTAAADVQFTISDELFDGRQIPLGTQFRYRDEDTLFVRLFHIDRAYYEFLTSLDDAQASNGNPFAQPAPVRSGVEGGIGAFAGLTFDQQMVIVRRE